MPGITGRQFHEHSLTFLQQYEFLLPIAADVDYAVTAADISTAVAGDALTLLTACAAGTPLAYPRMPTITSVDASGTNLSVTVRIVGRRFGKTVTQDITATGAGGGETVTGTKIIDEFVSASIASISNAAASDTVAVGVDSKWLGLPKRIKNVYSMKKLFKIANGTPTSTGCVAMATLQSTSVIDVDQAAINVYAACGNTAIAVTDRYLVEFIPDGQDLFLPYGHLK